MHPTRLFRILLHTVFWCGYLFFLLNISHTLAPWPLAILRSLMLASLHALLAYTNIYIWVPRLLETKKYPQFILVQLFAIAVISIIRQYGIDRLIVPSSELAEKMIHQPFLRFLFLTLSSFIVSIISSIYGYAEKRIVIQQAQLEGELKLLKAQINPHFLFNALNNIYSLTLEKSDNAAPMVLKLSEMMRYAYHDCDADKVMLEKEVLYIRNFMGLYQLRFEKARNIRFEVQAQDSTILIAPLLFNPLLENMIKYSDLDYNDEGFMDMQLRILKGGKLEFILRNSFDPDHRPPGTGIGLSNLKRRLALLYPGKHQFKAWTEGKAYTVHLEIQLV